jgi:hypothetical protein
VSQRACFGAMVVSAVNQQIHIEKWLQQNVVLASKINFNSKIVC